jgi:hypothetical protein
MSLPKVTPRAPKCWLPAASDTNGAMDVIQAVMIIELVAVCVLVVDAVLLVGAVAAVYRYLRRRQLDDPAATSDDGATKEALRTYT